MHIPEGSPATTDDDLSQFDLEVAAFDDYQPSLSRQGSLIGPTWAQSIIRFSITILPSFLHDLFSAWLSPGGASRPDHSHYEPVAKARQDTAFLDGMRGLAAFCVFLEHFLIPFWDGMFYAYGGNRFNGHKDGSLLQLPVIRLLYSGSPMVCIFFVISGIALSLKPVRLIKQGELDRAYRAIESMTFRRGIRLFGPSLLASFILMVTAHLHLCDVQLNVQYQGPAEIKDEFWMKQPQFVSSLWDQTAEWLDFVVAKVLIPSTWRGTTTGNDYGDLEHIEYGSQLWTVAVEYWSSLLLFVTLLGTTRLRIFYKLPLLGILSVFGVLVGRWDMALFLYGSLLANTDAFQTEITPKTGTLLRESLFVVVSCFGLHLASFPELGGASTPGFVWLHTLVRNPRVWQSIGGALIVTGAGNVRFIRQTLSCRLFLYLGRISFALYIVHIPLLVTMGWRLVPTVWRLTGREAYMENLGLAISFLVLLPLLIWVADLYCRFVDEPCTAFARKLEDYLQIHDN